LSRAAIAERNGTGSIKAFDLRDDLCQSLAIAKKERGNI